MKRIAIVTDDRKTRIGEALERDLKEVLGEAVEISTHAFDQLRPGDRIDTDLALVMQRDKALILRSFVPEARKILLVRRTFQERMVYRLFTIPPGTRVLVVNNAPEMTLETVTLLQQLEINHLQFVPYEPGMDCGDLRIAITPGERAMVPPEIPIVLDLGHRCIDTSTFIEVINRLGIADRAVDQRLFRYSERIIPLETGVNRQCKELYLRNSELDTVLNVAHEGVLLVNSEGRVALSNRALAEMLGVPEDLRGEPLAAFPPEVRRVLEQDSGQEGLLDYRGHAIVVSRRPIELFGEPAGSCFNFHEVTYIRQLEQSLSRKLQKKGLTARYRFPDILTRAPRMLQCVDLARRLAASDLTVLILGESGTGKELLAQSIHNASSRAKQPFVAINCAAVPENLLESELFGYEGGAFTGALKEGKAGLFEQANHGTVFLDEIADMPLVLQAKLLRVLQERQIMRIGSQRVVSVNIRVLAATNHDLRARIREGRFREDFYYRLNTLPLLVPPLRQRPEDILLLLEHFLVEHRHRRLRLDADAREVLLRYPWPGNIRELDNVASYLSFLNQDEVTRAMLPYYVLEEPPAAAEPGGRPPGGDARTGAILLALSRQDRGIGRRGLEAALAGDGLRLTEAEIRGALRGLNQAGLVRSRLGRRGSELTPRGWAFLNRLH